MQDIRYTRCTIEDWPKIQHFGRATYEPYYPHIWKPTGLDFYMDHCFGEENLTRDFENPTIEYYLPATSAGETIGILKLVNPKKVHGLALENAFYLEKIYLMPAFMGKGIGQKLMQFAEAKARASQRDAIWLTVLASGPQQAYERAGYTYIGDIEYPFELLKAPERVGKVMLKKLQYD